METLIVCPYCNHRYKFDVRYGEDDKIWRRLRPTKSWTAPIFGKGEALPTVTERCSCGAIFVFAKNEREAISALRRRRGRKRPMSVEETGVKVGGFTAYAVKRMMLIEEYRQIVGGKYESSFRKAVIPSEIPIKEGYYAMYHDGNDIILKYVGERVPAKTSKGDDPIP